MIWWIIIAVVIIVIISNSNLGDNSNNQTGTGKTNVCQESFFDNIYKAKITVSDTMQNYEAGELVYELSNPRKLPGYYEYFIDSSIPFSKRFHVISIELMDKDNKTIPSSHYSWSLVPLNEDDCGVLKVSRK